MGDSKCDNNDAAPVVMQLAIYASEYYFKK